MIKKIFILAYKLLRAEIAILIKKVNFEYLFAIWSISISKDIGNEEREYISESAIANIGAEHVVIVAVEELTQLSFTNSDEIPPA